MSQEKRVKLVEKGPELFARINNVIGELHRHYRQGMLDKKNIDILSTLFTKTVTRSPREVLYIVRCIKEEVEEFLDSGSEEAWSELQGLSHEATIYTLRMQHFISALVIESENVTESLYAKLELRRIYDSLLSEIVFDFHDWCYEVKMHVTDAQ